MDKLKKLLDLIGVSGYEEMGVSNYIYDLVKPLADDVQIDGMGNVIALKKGADPKEKIMLITSIDQRGFIVTVKDGKALRMGAIGSYDDNLPIGQMVEFNHGARGIISSDADEAAKVKNLYVDIIEGTADVGDIFTCCDNPYVNEDCIASGRLYARVGAYVLIQVMEQLKNNKNDVYFVFATHGEVAFRGSKTAAFAVSPQMAITVGTVCTGDMPGSEKSNITLDGGPAIKIKDTSILAHPRIKNGLIDSAQNLGIKYQAEVSGETSEGGVVHIAKGAVMTGGVSVPLRYKGSTTELCLIENINNTVKLILGSDLL